MTTAHKGLVVTSDITHFSDRHFWHGGYDKAFLRNHPQHPSGLGALAARAQMLRRSEGTIGEVAALLAAAADAALLAGEERIGMAALEEADYQPPSVRRRLFERELR